MYQTIHLHELRFDDVSYYITSCKHKYFDSYNNLRIFAFIIIVLYTFVA